MNWWTGVAITTVILEMPGYKIKKITIQFAHEKGDYDAEIVSWENYKKVKD